MTASSATIFALSSGRPPAGIAVVRVSGPDAGAALRRLSGRMPTPRRASLAALRDASGELLDRALVLWLPGPATSTGEDVAELHLHGGHAVVDAVLGALSAQPGMRPAQAGEFTRRAFDNGRIDLNEAEGLADLLAAETDAQRRSALQSSGGALSRLFEGWQDRLLAIAAAIEAEIDHSEEDDVASGTPRPVADAAVLADEIAAVVARPPVERLRDGVRVVFAGPPNSGKSSLVNALCGRDAALESPIPGTTRDLIEVPISLEGLPFILVDTAGLRDSIDPIEVAGVAKANGAIDDADILLWLGDEAGPDGPSTIHVHSRVDIRPRRHDRLSVSASTGEGIDELLSMIVTAARVLLPREGEVALSRRHRVSASELVERLHLVQSSSDILIVADHIRRALNICDELTGRAGTEEMLGTLFGRFCIGK